MSAMYILQMRRIIGEKKNKKLGMIPLWGKWKTLERFISMPDMSQVDLNFPNEMAQFRIIKGAVPYWRSANKRRDKYWRLIEDNASGF